MGEFGRNLGVIQFPDMVGDFSSRHVSCVHRENLLVKSIKMGLVPCYQLGFKVAVPITGNFDPHVALGSL